MSVAPSSSKEKGKAKHIQMESSSSSQEDNKMEELEQALAVSRLPQADSEAGPSHLLSPICLQSLLLPSGDNVGSLWEEQQGAVAQAPVEEDMVMEDLAVGRGKNELV